MKVSRKMLGDAGEHYALSQFTLAGHPSSKMPDNWEGYDLAVESGQGLLRVSVKTRKETEKWSKGSWFMFDDRKECDWIVFIFVGIDAKIRSWIIPFEIALESANQPGPARKNPWERDISWKKLNECPLADFEENWDLNTEPGEGGQLRSLRSLRATS
jgi:hypothetical protein